MKIIKGILTSKLETDNPKVLKALSDKYAFYVPGYNYTAQYKKKVWDGKKRYFKLNGLFNTGLLPKILKDLETIEADFTIENSYDEDSTFYSLQPVKKFKYRDYQIDAINHCIKTKRCILESPTSSGKTLMMAGVLASLVGPSDKAVVLIPEVGILDQTYKFFKSCGLDSLGVNFGGNFLDGNIMLTTPHSIEKIIDSHLYDAKLLMVDEAHKFCKGDTTIAAIEAFPNAEFRFAFTATPPSTKAKDINARMVLEGAFGPVYSTISVSDLIKRGQVAKPIIQIINVEEEHPELAEDMAYIDIYERYITLNEKRNNLISLIAEKIKISNPSAKILILVKDLAHLSVLSEKIPGSITIEGKDKLDDRYGSIAKFVESSTAEVIIGTNVMQTGISIDDITHMINARGLNGEIPTIQGLGRGIRKGKDKSTLYFYDFMDNVKYLNTHAESRIKHYKKLKFEINYAKL